MLPCDAMPGDHDANTCTNRTVTRRTARVVDRHLRTTVQEPPRHCSDCAGRGKHSDEGGTCATCQGKGRTPALSTNTAIRVAECMEEIKWASTRSWPLRGNGYAGNPWTWISCLWVPEMASAPPCCQTVPTRLSEDTTERSTRQRSRQCLTRRHGRNCNSKFGAGQTRTAPLPPQRAAAGFRTYLLTGLAYCGKCGGNQPLCWARC